MLDTHRNNYNLFSCDLNLESLGEVHKAVLETKIALILSILMLVAIK